MNPAAKLMCKNILTHIKLCQLYIFDSTKSIRYPRLTYLVSVLTYMWSLPYPPEKNKPTWHIHISGNGITQVRNLNLKSRDLNLSFTPTYLSKYKHGGFLFHIVYFLYLYCSDYLLYLYLNLIYLILCVRLFYISLYFVQFFSRLS